jgi:hypothetical protein
VSHRRRLPARQHAALALAAAVAVQLQQHDHTQSTAGSQVSDVCMEYCV